jgi:hypothetical protein
MNSLFADDIGPSVKKMSSGPPKAFGVVRGQVVALENEELKMMNVGALKG